MCNFGLKFYDEKLTLLLHPDGGQDLLNGPQHTCA